MDLYKKQSYQGLRLFKVKRVFSVSKLAHFAERNICMVTEYSVTDFNFTDLNVSSDTCLVCYTECVAVKFFIVVL